ncbi:MAG: molecular chaperone [Methylococcales bacterium]|nr:molecular chaperone [Methylococcales bacterium]
MNGLAYYVCSFYLVLFLLLFGIQNVLAFSVSPSVVELTSLGKMTHSSISAVNNSETPLPIEIKIYKVELNLKGDVSKKEAGDEFLVFPPQAMIAPGATQNFRVQWVGEPDIKKSQNFLFYVNQIPVKTLATKEKRVQVVFNHGVYVNVRPLQGDSKLSIVKVEVGKDDKGILRPIITVKNSGNIHARLADASLYFSAGDWNKKLSSTDIHQKIGVGLIQANRTRRFMVNMDIPQTLTSMKTSIEYKPWWRK